MPIRSRALRVSAHPLGIRPGPDQSDGGRSQPPLLYWEVTDPAIAKARQGLGPGGKDAWLSLRIYDTTGRIFDGTNAHGYIDIKVERSDRQWFVHIGKPASTHVIEIGLKSLEGYFVRIARSGRADFPRFEPSPDGTVDWLSVRTSTGPVADPSRGSGGAPGGGPPPMAPAPVDPEVQDPADHRAGRARVDDVARANRGRSGSSHRVVVARLARSFSDAMD